MPSGHGVDKPRKENHPNRQVGRERSYSGLRPHDEMMMRSRDRADDMERARIGPDFASQGWPATTEEWEGRGAPNSPVRHDDVSLGEHQGWHYIQHRPGDRKM